MGSTKLEERVTELESRFSQQIADLEAQVSRLSNQANEAVTPDVTAWWKKIVGVYRDDPEFDEAMRLGREYRESLRPQEDEDAS